MPKKNISIPFSVALTSEDAWNKDPERKYCYHIIRSHFLLRQRNIEEPVRRGHRIAVFENHKNFKQEIVQKITCEHKHVRFKKSISEIFQQEDFFHEYGAILATELSNSGLGKINSEIKEKSQHHLKEAFKSSFTLQDAYTKKVEETYELKYQVDPLLDETLVAVAMYEKCAYDLYLTWTDYLEVRYVRNLYGVRKKRLKRPKVTSPRHPNWICHNTPLATIKYWKPLFKSSVVIREKDYVNQVGNPLDIEICPPEYFIKHYAPKPDVPSLYQISNIAFPLKWIHREGDWTEEDLKKIEHEERDQAIWCWQTGKYFFKKSMQ